MTTGASAPDPFARMDPSDDAIFYSVERKVVHIRLKEFDGVETTSEGTEPNRFVVIKPL